MQKESVTAIVLNKLELTQASFHKLVELLDEETAKGKSVVTKRSLKAVVAHLVISTEVVYPMFVARAKKRKAMPRFFGTTLGHWFSYKLSEFRAKRASLKSLQSAYDLAHQKLIDIVEDLTDEDWQLYSQIPKPRNERMTLEDFFCVHIPRHMAIHNDEILKTIKAIAS